ncbi:MAG: murein biosynthesis integral membrane protein MurJ [Acidobacteria bacterium]|nr:MAG: murein biosynthesis integral membrane protein MurJ [Acidobacteriota bacterium]
MKPSEPAAPAAASTAPATGLHPSGTAVAGSAAVIGVATMTSRVLGLGRNLVFASLFGASSAMDAFFVAFRIPNLMRDLFAEGAMSAAFVPTFTRRLTTEGRAAAWRLGTQLINALIVITGVLVLAAIIFAEPLTRLFARDFAEVPGKLELTVRLTRVMLPFLTLVAVAAACMGMLNSLRRFFIPALSPAMFNISVILSGLLLVPLMPQAGFERIMAIACGVVLGGIGQIAIQYWMLHREGFRYRFTLDPTDRGLREVLRLMGPATIAGAALQVNLVVTTILATSQGTGAVSWLTYAFQVMYLPIGVLGVSIATAAIPVLSRHAALGELHQMRRTISHSLRLMLMLMVPATVGLVVLAVPIVRLLFERRAFTPADTQATALALACYAPGMVGYSVVRLAVPSFYALGTSLTPALVSAGTVGLNIVLNLVLVRVMGYQGLALGNAIAALSNAALLLALLRRRLDGLEGASIADSFARITVAAAVMGVAVWQANLWMTALWPGTGVWTQLLIVASDIGVGLAVLGAAARVLGLAEYNQAKDQILARLTRTRSR